MNVFIYPECPFCRKPLRVVKIEADMSTTYFWDCENCVLENKIEEFNLPFITEWV